jgi:hypothetical protein
LGRKRKEENHAHLSRTLWKAKSSRRKEDQDFSSSVNKEKNSNEGRPSMQKAATEESEASLASVALVNRKQPAGILRLRESSASQGRRPAREMAM